MVKARKQKLKVFRTPIGFHDAYVAARSQKAALEAWGSDADLFARGSAEEVRDPELTKAPLAKPGEVIKALRGSEAEQIRALGKSPAKPKRRKATNDDENDRPSPRSSHTPERKAKRPPRPSRAPLDRAEKALNRAEQKHLDQIAKVKSEAQALEKRYGKERDRLRERVEQARDLYAAALSDRAED